jgi:hypothetical protein
MMGSPPPPISSNVQALSVLTEIVDLLRNGPKDIKDQIKSLQDLHKSVSEEVIALDKVKIEHLALANTNTKASESLSSREVEINNKISLNNEREVKLNKFNEDLHTRQQKLNNDTKEFEALKKTTASDLSQKLKAAEQEIATKLQVCDKEIKAKQTKADQEIKTKQEAFNASLETQRAELAQQAARISSSESQLRSRMEQLRAVLPNFNGA